MTEPKGTGDFFTVDRRAFDFVCKLGLNQAVSYLVLARGTGGDNRTTSWSVNAVESYTGVGRRRAKKSFEALAKSGVIRLTQETPRRYFLVPAHEITGCEGYPPEKRERRAEPYDADTASQPDWIWLPNAMIDGAADEIRPGRAVATDARRGGPAAARAPLPCAKPGLRWRHSLATHKGRIFAEQGRARGAVHGMGIYPHARQHMERSTIRAAVPDRQIR